MMVAINDTNTTTHNDDHLLYCNSYILGPYRIGNDITPVSTQDYGYKIVHQLITRNNQEEEESIVFPIKEEVIMD